MADPDNLLNARGAILELGAHVVAVAFAPGGMAAFALGDGTVRLAPVAERHNANVAERREAPVAERHEASVAERHEASVAERHEATAHEGAVLCLVAHPAHGFLSGGDDGRLNAVALDGTVTTLARFGGKWVEHLAVAAGKSGQFAAAVGKTLHLYAADGAALRALPHPSTVTGLAFDQKGKRVAAAHYNGASLWFTGSNSETPRRLEWKGSHLGVAIHPGGDAVVTGMQENALHGWTLPEGKHMRMSGYPAKPESFGFTKSGRWLVTAGADAAVLWPFFGGGPMGKPPLEMAGGNGTMIRRVACHPEHEVFAAGFDDGMIILGDIAKEQILPVCGPGRGSVTALGWNATGSHLAFGAESGFAGVVDFSTG